MADDEKHDFEWDKLLRQAWLNTSIERDKAIITLSSAGLAVLVTFITKVARSECLIRLFLLIGLLGFTTSVIAGVRCLHINRHFIERELRREPEPKSSLADYLLIWGFISGVVSVALIGVAIIFSP